MSDLFEANLKRIEPPFRADHVGSFLRTEPIKKARIEFHNGLISAAQLKHVEDQEIKQLVEKQIECGLKAVTDGEFRRSWWHLDFMSGLDGISKFAPEKGFVFQGMNTRPETVRLSDHIGFSDHPMLDHFKYLKACSGNHIAKMSIPSPAMLHFVLAIRDSEFILPSFYADEDEFISEIVDCYRDALKSFYDAGCRYLQLDDTSWGALCSVEQRKNMTDRGISPDDLSQMYVDLINSVIKNCPKVMNITMHICRGNYRSTWFSSGGYEPIAKFLFANVGLDGFFLEYDTDRAGDFYPLRHINDQQVVLGLISSKTGEMENSDMIKSRIEEASQLVPLDQLCLSPQCGFSSTEEGNILTAENQWNKISMIVKVASDVWG